MKTTTDTLHGTPESFLARFGEHCSGILSGFDRMRFMGSFRTLQDARGMAGYLYRAGVLLKRFGDYAEELTERVREHARALAAAAGLEVEYLTRSTERKQLLAQEAVRQRGGREGLVSVYSCVEPCRTFGVQRDARQRQLVLKARQGKCLHFYFYFLHPRYGLLHLRLQTWFPFTVTVCLNGRQWLAQQLKEAGVGFAQQGNCFTQLADVAAAQRLSDQQLETDWTQLLQGLLTQCHPLAAEIGAPIGQSYYWTLKESEYATDVLFNSPEELAALYPRFLHHALEHFGSQDVLRFLGSRSTARTVHGNFEGELYSTLRGRPEGVCLKHYAAGNSIKLYDKEGQVLRVETTIHHPEVFKVYRPTATPGPDGEEVLQWQRMRKAVADIHRRAEVSRAANTRYLEGMATVSSREPVGPLAATIFGRVEKDGRRYRALNPWHQPDADLLEAISAGQWTINGFRNRDLRTALYGTTTDAAEAKRQSARVTRLLGLLRAHGIIHKIGGTHRYQVSARGRQIITALQAARRASIEELAKIAA
jgi:hypothetical protein